MIVPCDRSIMTFSDDSPRPIDGAIGRYAASTEESIVNPRMLTPQGYRVELRTESGSRCLASIVLSPRTPASQRTFDLEGLAGATLPARR